MARTSLTNLVPAAILSSPLHRILNSKRLVLTFTGRRSGIRYATPVNYLQRGREVLITTDSSWWHNLDGGALVELQLRGRKLRATAQAVRDPDLIADALTAIVRDHPPYGRWAHVRVSADGTPDAADVRAEVARGRILVRVQLPPEDTTAPGPQRRAQWHGFVDVRMTKPEMPWPDPGLAGAAPAARIAAISPPPRVRSPPWTYSRLSR